MGPEVDAVLSLVSGVPLVVLGALLFLPRPRGALQVFFGAFAVLWGLQVVAANAGRVVGDARVHHVLLLVCYGLLAPASVFLVHFAWRASGRPRGPWLVLAAGATACVASAVVLVAPEQVVARVDTRPGGFVPTLGPLAAPLFLVPFYLAFYAAVALLDAAYREAPGGSPRHRFRALLLALVLATGYTTVRGLFVFLGVTLRTRTEGAASTVLLLVLFGGGVALLGAIALRLALRPPAPEERDRTLLAAFAVPACVALGEVLLERRGVVVETLGLWRLLSVAVLVHALARHRLFDIDLRLKRSVGPAVAALAFGTGALATALLVAGGTTTARAGIPLLAGTVAAGAGVAFRGPLGRLLFPWARDGPDYVRQRKLEVYRGALEDALAAGRDPDDALRHLRRDLGITEREHEAMEVAVAWRPPPTRPGLLLGRFRVERLLGEGAHGRAFLAHDEQERRDVVVKVVGTAALGGRASEALRREARLLAEAAHPNVVAVRDVVEGANEVLLVMEYAPGGNLHGLLRRRGVLSLAEALDVADDLLAALEAAHARGVVHRDVKPENVLIAADGRALLADFGLARRSGPEATGRTAEAAGTLLYMAPEQVRGADVGPAADLYAAAVVLHLALTGRHVLRLAGRDDFALREAILKDPPEVAVRDPRVRDVLRKALAKDPAERFPSAGAMRAALATARAAPPQSRASFKSGASDRPL